MPCAVLVRLVCLGSRHNRSAQPFELVNIGPPLAPRSRRPQYLGPVLNFVAGTQQLIYPQQVVHVGTRLDSRPLSNLKDALALNPLLQRPAALVFRGRAQPSAVPQVVFPSAFVRIAGRVDHHSDTAHFPSLPIAVVGVAVRDDPMDWIRHERRPEKLGTPVLQIDPVLRNFDLSAVLVRRDLPSVDFRPREKKGALAVPLVRSVLAFVDGAVGKRHLAVPVLLTRFVLAFESLSISVSHLSVAIHLVVAPIAMVHSSTRERHPALPVLAALLPAAFEAPAVGVFHRALAVHLTAKELPVVHVAVRVRALMLAIREVSPSVEHLDLGSFAVHALLPLAIHARQPAAAVVLVLLPRAHVLKRELIPRLRAKSSQEGAACLSGWSRRRGLGRVADGCQRADAARATSAGVGVRLHAVAAASPLEEAPLVAIAAVFQDAGAVHLVCKPLARVCAAVFPLLHALATPLAVLPLARVPGAGRVNHLARALLLTAGAPITLVRVAASQVRPNSIQALQLAKLQVGETLLPEPSNLALLEDSVLSNGLPRCEVHLVPRPEVIGVGLQVQVGRLAPALPAPPGVDNQLLPRLVGLLHFRLPLAPPISASLQVVLLGDSLFHPLRVLDDVAHLPAEARLLVQEVQITVVERRESLVGESDHADRLALAAEHRSAEQVLGRAGLARLQLLLAGMVKARVPRFGHIDDASRLHDLTQGARFGERDPNPLRRALSQGDLADQLLLRLVDPEERRFCAVDQAAHLVHHLLRHAADV